MLDLSPQEGLQRAKARATLDRFENEQLSFHERVRNAYLKRAQLHSDRMVVIPANGQSIDAIFDKVLEKINERSRV